MSSAVAYYRVSTQRQGRSGLGIEAQKNAVARFAEAAGIGLLQEFTEVETARSGRWQVSNVRNVLSRPSAVK